MLLYRRVQYDSSNVSTFRMGTIFINYTLDRVLVSRMFKELKMRIAVIEITQLKTVV